MKKIYADTNGLNAAANESELGHLYLIDFGDGSWFTFRFQTGPVNEAGVNGVTTEALLAILIHRTMVMEGKSHCAENLVAIDGMVKALGELERRTLGRLARGVEGTKQV